VPGFDAPLVVTGFVGARFVASCNERSIPVISVDEPRHFAERAEHRGVDFGRIVGRELLVAWLEEDRPAVSGIVHLGACTRNDRARRRQGR
jgi:nucleoside-diphosphate-sugar epimerase